MNTAAIYRQYQTYVRSDKSGWALDGCSDSALMAQAKQPGLHLEMCINRFDSGITLSRMRGGGTGAFPTEIHNFSHNCALFVMVSGQNRLQMGGREYRPSAGEIWLVRGELADVSETLLPDNGGMCALHLDFSLEKLRRWHDEGLLDERLFSPQTIGRFALQRLAQNAAALTAAVRPLLQRPFESDGFGLLTDEAAALEKFEKIRAYGALKMGLINDVSEAAARAHTPKVAFVAPAADYTASSGKTVNAADIDLLVRALSMGKLHHAMMGTASVAIAAAAARTRSGSESWRCPTAPTAGDGRNRRAHRRYW